jgi:hypothetical protein
VSVNDFERTRPLGHYLCTVHSVRIFHAAVYDVNNRVCWGPLLTRKDTRRILGPLYNRRSGIQAPEIET